MPRSEAQVRYELVDPALDALGYRRGIDITVEETAAPIYIVQGKGERWLNGRTDYVSHHLTSA